MYRDDYDPAEYDDDGSQYDDPLPAGEPGASHVWCAYDLDDAFRPITGDEPVTEFDWLVKGMIERGKAGILFGQNQSYKSFFIIALALHMMAGRRLAGRRTKARGQAFIYVPFEGESSVPTRLREARRDLGVKSDDVRFEVMRAKPFDSQDGYDFFAASLRRYKQARNDVSMVVIDTVNQAKFFDGTPGNSENDPAAWARVYSFMKALAIELDVTIMLVHHAGKDLSFGGRGSSANTDDADFALTISSEKDQVTGKAVNHWLHQSKIKDGGSSGPICAIIPHEVQLGTDEDGDPITTLTLEFDETANYTSADDRGRRSSEKPTGKYDEAVMQALGALVESGEGVRGGQFAPKGLVREKVAHLLGVNVSDSLRKGVDRACMQLGQSGKIVSETISGKEHLALTAEE